MHSPLTPLYISSNPTHFWRPLGSTPPSSTPQCFHPPFSETPREYYPSECSLSEYSPMFPSSLFGDPWGVLPQRVLPYCRVLGRAETMRIDQPVRASLKLDCLATLPSYFARNLRQQSAKSLRAE